MPETSEEEDGEEAEDKEDGEIPLSQDIGLISTEVNEPEEVEESEEPVETEDGEIGLSPEEAQRLGAQTSLRNMLNELDTDDNLRKQETNEEENEETLYYQQEKEKCPILEMSRDCQFADMLNIPLNGRKRDLCNRHEMCYICGSTIGLGASICDRGFLADSIKECNGNLNCIRLADTFLRLMRVTHKFNAMPNSVCNVACVRDYVIGLWDELLSASRWKQEAESKESFAVELHIELFHQSCGSPNTGSLAELHKQNENKKHKDNTNKKEWLSRL